MIKSLNMAKNKSMLNGKCGNSLDILSKCSFCGKMLQQDNLTVIEEQENKTTFHLACPQCQTASVVVISGNQAGIISVGLATDLDKNEVKNKFAKNAINVDEVIDVHEFISKYDGSLADLVEDIK